MDKRNALQGQILNEQNAPQQTKFASGQILD